jgi:MFS family permease
VNLDQLSAILQGLAQQYHPDMDVHALKTMSYELVNYKIMLPGEILRSGLDALQSGSIDAGSLAKSWAKDYRQINPEYIVNIGFGSIVIGQIAISSYIQRFEALPVMVIGTFVLSLGIAVLGIASLLSSGGLILILGVSLFSVGEMIASPKSQEYVAAIAPKNKTAMYMGYYFVSMALGNLFAGLLSGWAYTAIAKESERPMLMWLIFAFIGFGVAITLLIFNRSLLNRK